MSLQIYVIIGNNLSCCGELEITSNKRVLGYKRISELAALHICFCNRLDDTAKQILYRIQ